MNVGSGATAYIVPGHEQQFNPPPPWWENPSGLLGQFSPTGCESRSYDWYRIVDTFLGIDSDDPALRKRFLQLYGECLWSPPPETKNTHWLRCRVQVNHGAPADVVTFTASEEVDIVDFILSLFGDRGYVEMHQGLADWRSLGLAGKDQPLLAVKGNQVLVDARESWQPLIASCAINWAMRMQPEMLFFHAAAVGIDGAGVLITGDKGAGKSTLSMALAASGHSFFGDEIAAVRSRTMALESFRRAVSVRPGPRSHQVEKLLQLKSYPTERFPDGTIRTRAQASELFPDAGAISLPLRSIFFLSGFEDKPRTQAFVPRVADLRLLTPLPCAFWGASPASPMMQVAKLLSRVNCYHLHPGQPEDTARLVERIVRAG
jgi:hypothetical protein